MATRRLEENEKFWETWKRNNLLCRCWCRLHEDRGVSKNGAVDFFQWGAEDVLK